MQYGNPELPKVNIYFLNYNRSNEVIKSIKDFLVINYPADKFDLIVIDNCSTDDSANKVEKEFINYPNVSVIRQEKNYIALSRNVAINNTSANYNFIFDDDISPNNPDLIFDTVQLLEKNKQFAALCFECVNYYSGAVEFADFMQYSAKRVNDIGDCIAVVGCGMCFRTEAMTGFGGYENWMNWGGEEFGLALKMMHYKLKIAYTPKLRILHRRAERVIKSDKSMEFDLRTNIKSVSMFFPIPIAFCFILFFTSRRLLKIIFNKDKALFYSWKKGIKSAVADLPEIIRNRKPITMAYLAYYNRWFLNLFNIPRHTISNINKYGHP